MATHPCEPRRWRARKRLWHRIRSWIGLVCYLLQCRRRHPVATVGAEAFLVTIDVASLRETLSVAAASAAGELGVIVPTTTLLPTGALASVHVTQDGDGIFSVSDEGAARAILLDSGVHRIRPSDRRKGNEIAQRLGLEVDGDAFLLRRVTTDQLASAIVYVADATGEWATYLTDRLTRSREGDLSEILQESLWRAFSPSQVEREGTILGASNTKHRFDFVVHVNTDVLAAFEIVSAAPQSIAAAHLKFSDLERRERHWPREGIVSNLSDWNSEAIALLSQVCTNIRAPDSSWDDLRSLAIH